MPRVSRRLVLAAIVVSGTFTWWQLSGPDEIATPAPTAQRTRPVDPAVTTTGATIKSVPANFAAAPASASAVVAFHELPVETPLIEAALRTGDPAALRTFTVRLGPSRTAEIDVARFDHLNDDEGVYSGTVRGAADSQAVFSYVGLAHAGTVVLGAEQRAFYITATEDGLMRITELDLTRAPLCGQPLLAQATPGPVQGL